jgi:hypothetical protein
MGKRYAVLDGNNKVVNHILCDDPMPKGYWPGYGKTLVPLEPVTFSKSGAALDVVQFDKWPVLPQIGDTVDLATGIVTKFEPQIITQKDDKGDDVLVSSAPDVKLATDVAPKAAGTVTTKTSTATDPKEPKVGGK